jgi:two-component system chemotaxis response regulator CheB
VTGRDVAVVGASAGGVEALTALVGELPEDYAGCLLIVLHVPATGSLLPQILGRATPLEVRHAAHGDQIEPGRVLVAPPDRHLLVHDGVVMLSHGPRENGHRPAVDVLFRSAAAALGSRVTGVVLSGALDDGAAGAVAVKLRGGTLLVQDPGEAFVPSMPKAAIAAAEVDAVLSTRDIAARLVELAKEPVPPEPPASELMQRESAMARTDADEVHTDDPVGEAAGYGCPDCNGTLYRIEEGGLVRFRCRVGHAWSAEALGAQQDVSTEAALWVALRTLEERASLARELGERAEQEGHRLTAEQFARRAEEATGSAELVRELITRLNA